MDEESQVLQRIQAKALLNEMHVVPLRGERHEAEASEEFSEEDIFLRAHETGRRRSTEIDPGRCATGERSRHTKVAKATSVPRFISDE